MDKACTSTAVSFTLRVVPLETSSLRIAPAALADAASAIRSLAHRLDDAGQAFAAQAAHDVGELGSDSAAAAAQGAAATVRATAIITADITTVAHALGVLAGAYPHVDRTAVAGAR